MQALIADLIETKFTDNRARYNGKKTGHYEVWFLTFNDRASGCGFWFRYAIDIHQEATEAIPSLWGCFFDPRDSRRNFGLKRAFPANDFHTSQQSESLVIGVNDNRLHLDRLNGSLNNGKHSIAWDLKFTPDKHSFHHIDEMARRLFKPKTEICAPNLATEFIGKVEVDGETFHLDRAPGCQQHIWGSKHAEGWGWVHCNSFAEESDAAFEALAAQPKFGPMTLPPLTLACLRFRGEEYCFNTIYHFLGASNRLSEFSWRFTIGDAHTRISGEAQGRPEEMLQVEYPDPDGESLFCINSEIADLKITLERRSGRLSRWFPIIELHSSARAHFERASRQRQWRVEMIGLI